MDVATAERWNGLLGPYHGPELGRSLTQLVLTAGLFAGLWAAMLASLSVGYWLTLLLALPAAGFLMRLFMIQHDLGHGSFFGSARASDAVGFVLGVLTLTPYHYWRRTHAYHHAHSGDLGFRGVGDIETWTVREYLGRSRPRRLIYRLLRHPLVLFGVGPAFHFMIKHRYPWDIPRRWKREWASVHWTNLALAGVVALAWATIGLDRFLLVQLPITLLAGSLGVWLFYVQHQFETTYWHDHARWDYHEAGLMGSSHLVLPRPLEWLTAYIGLHHIHHLSARIPNYKLARCQAETRELWQATRLGLRDGLRTMRLALWDEEARRLISFRELRAASAG